MELEVKGNKNYCATVVEIKNIIDLDGCDNIKGTTIQGNHVIVGKDVNVGDIGIYFPVESKLSEAILSTNNLYCDSELNSDKTKKVFFSQKGRVRAVKLKGFKSDGFFIPTSCLSFVIEKDLQSTLKDGDTFDTIDGVLICEKYAAPCHNGGQGNARKETKANKKFDRIIPSQFKFHIDTAQLGKSLCQIHPEDIITISQKLHGTSFIVSNVLCNRELTWKDKLAKRFGVAIKETEYESVYASRKVIKNKFATKSFTVNPEESWKSQKILIKKKRVKDFFFETYNTDLEIEYSGLYRQIFSDENKDPHLYDTFNYFDTFETLKGIKDWYTKTYCAGTNLGYYGTDIWGIVSKKLEPFLQKSMTIYGECVGYLSDGKMVQKSFDYGCNKGEHANYVYRITTTNEDGKVYEWSMLQVQQWCKANGLNAVPLMYYGTVADLYQELFDKYPKEYNSVLNMREVFDSNIFLELLTKEYLEKPCERGVVPVYCLTKKVPDEGIVLRKESLDIESYKLKSFAFKMKESSDLDKGEENIEDNQEG
jgi:hypothetical protein